MEGLIQFTTLSAPGKRKKAEALILPFQKGKEKAEPLCTFDEIDVSGPIGSKDFKGKEGEVAVVYCSQGKEPRCLLLGLGEGNKVTMEVLRRAYSAVAKSLQQLKVKSVNLVLPENLSVLHDDLIRGVAEGLLLTNYVFETYKSLKENERTVLLEQAALIGASKKDEELIHKLSSIMQGVFMTRDLVNLNADDATPAHLVSMAKHLEKTQKKLKATIFGKKEIEKEKMGLLLAVNRGSHIDPAFIMVEYRGNPKSSDHTILVGKGVTYDTGGLNLKPTGSMEEMKCDMAGAATVLGIMHAVAELGLKVNVTGVIPATENSIGSRSYKPGDVYKGYSGKTVEIGNTDAEGRLILADALAYAEKKLKPTRIIDFATLTGAMVISLGEEVTGVMSNDDALVDSLIRAGNVTFERLCRLPIYEEYRDQLKSDIADIKNVGGRPAGSITAALFLKEFIGETPWTHFDIAGTAFLSKGRRYHPKGGTGICVRLIVEFLESLTP